MLQEPPIPAALPLENTVREWCMTASDTNTEIAFLLFLTLPVTVAASEGSFNKLKIFKKYLRSTMSQQRLTELVILSIEYPTASLLHYNNGMDDFASAEDGKVKF